MSYTLNPVANTAGSQGTASVTNPKDADDAQDLKLQTRPTLNSATAVTHPNTQTQQGTPALTGNSAPGGKDGSNSFYRWW